jgi:hypothetical protein
MHLDIEDWLRSEILAFFYNGLIPLPFLWYFSSLKQALINKYWLIRWGLIINKLLNNLFNNKQIK